MKTTNPNGKIRKFPSTNEESDNMQNSYCDNKPSCLTELKMKRGAKEQNLVYGNPEIYSGPSPTGLSSVYNNQLKFLADKPETKFYSSQHGHTQTFGNSPTKQLDHFVGNGNLDEEESQKPSELKRFLELNRSRQHDQVFDITGVQNEIKCMNIQKHV